MGLVIEGLLEVKMLLFLFCRVRLIKGVCGCVWWRGGGCLCGEIRIVKSDSESSSFVKTLGAELGVARSSLVSFAPRRSRVEEKLNSRDAHSLEFSETDRRALKQLCYTSFTARVRILLPVYRVELMLHLGKLGPV